MLICLNFYSDFSTDSILDYLLKRFITDLYVCSLLINGIHLKYVYWIFCDFLLFKEKCVGRERIKKNKRISRLATLILSVFFRFILVFFVVFSSFFLSSSLNLFSFCLLLSSCVYFFNSYRRMKVIMNREWRHEQKVKRHHDIQT